MIAHRKPHREPASQFRSSWKGQLRFGLVSFGVEAVNIRAPDRGPLHFHQLHAGCHSRIRYQKVCPIHGEVSQDEIVSGYEYRPGQFVEIDRDELDDLRTADERALVIDTFIRPDRLDPIFFDGRMYYLVPAGRDTREPYELLYEVMKRHERWAIGQVVFSGKDQLATVRPVDGLLSMAMLSYPEEVRTAEETRPAGGKHEVSPKMLKLAEDLVKQWSARKFDLNSYHDRYAEHVKELVEAKVAGREVVTPEEEEEPPVINLTDALKRSIAGNLKKPERSGRTKHSLRATRPRAKTTRKRAS